MRVLLADPPAFTPRYDHELAAALARAGADVDLATSRFRFGELPDPEGEMLRGLRAKVLELESRMTGIELATDHHHQEHHLAFDALPPQLWAVLGENGVHDEEFTLGSGI